MGQFLILAERENCASSPFRLQVKNNKKNKQQKLETENQLDRPVLGATVRASIAQNSTLLHSHIFSPVFVRFSSSAGGRFLICGTGKCLLPDWPSFLSHFLNTGKGVYKTQKKFANGKDRVFSSAEEGGVGFRRSQ